MHAATKTLWLMAAALFSSSCAIAFEAASYGGNAPNKRPDLPPPPNAFYAGQQAVFGGRWENAPPLRPPPPPFAVGNGPRVPAQLAPPPTNNFQAADVRTFTATSTSTAFFTTLAKKRVVVGGKSGGKVLHESPIVEAAQNSADDEDGPFAPPPAVTIATLPTALTRQNMNIYRPLRGKTAHQPTTRHFVNVHFAAKLFSCVCERCATSDGKLRPIGLLLVGVGERVPLLNSLAMELSAGAGRRFKCLGAEACCRFEDDFREIQQSGAKYCRVTVRNDMHATATALLPYVLWMTRDAFWMTQKLAAGDFRLHGSTLFVGAAASLISVAYRRSRAPVFWPASRKSHDKSGTGNASIDSRPVFWCDEGRDARGRPLNVTACVTYHCNRSIGGDSIVVQSGLAATFDVTVLGPSACPTIDALEAACGEAAIGSQKSREKASKKL